MTMVYVRQCYATLTPLPKFGPRIASLRRKSALSVPEHVAESPEHRTFTLLVSDPHAPGL